MASLSTPATPPTSKASTALRSFPSPCRSSRGAAQTRTSGRAGGGATVLTQLGHVLVDEADDGRALADRGRAALDRAGADVARGVDAGDARLQQAFGAGGGAGG